MPRIAVPINSVTPVVGQKKNDEWDKAIVVSSQNDV